MVESEHQLISPDKGEYYTFTVFTPTYNRAYTLPRVYESLKQQTYKDFEWLIVDDGSTDNTSELVEEWQHKSEFAIHYIYQNNSGKHNAYNLAAREAKGQFFICLDSDDACVPEALEQFKYHWDSISPDERQNFSGVDCLCQDQNGNVIGSYYPSNPTDANYFEIRYRLKVDGEKWGFQRTEVLREFPFPAIISQKLYVPENIVWSSIAQHYKIRCVNECLRIYYIDSTTDQITQSDWVRKNPVGFNLMCRSLLDKDIDYFRFDPWFFIRYAINYSRSSFHLKTNIKQQFISLNSGFGKLLWLITIPLGTMLWLKDRFKKNYPSEPPTLANFSGH
ncbi:MAG TPA: glycosyltransferase family 2 protein [Coleofasciculaceae cyanobacterium]